MAQEKILPEGIRFFSKNVNAPDFVKGSCVISLNELIAFAQARPDLLSEYQGKKQLKLQLLESKDGKLYATVDTYKKPEQPPAATNLPPAPTWDGTQWVLPNMQAPIQSSNDNLPF